MRSVTEILNDLQLSADKLNQLNATILECCQRPDSDVEINQVNREINEHVTTVKLPLLTELAAHPDFKQFRDDLRRLDPYKQECWIKQILPAQQLAPGEVSQCSGETPTIVAN